MMIFSLSNSFQSKAFFFLIYTLLHSLAVVQLSIIPGCPCLCFESVQANAKSITFPSRKGIAQCKQLPSPVCFTTTLARCFNYKRVSQQARVHSSREARAKQRGKGLSRISEGYGIHRRKKQFRAGRCFRRICLRKQGCFNANNYLCMDVVLQIRREIQGKLISLLETCCIRHLLGWVSPGFLVYHDTFLFLFNVGKSI